MGGNGAVAPHAAATRTGHQAQRTVVDPSDTDADVVTAFHPDSESERTLLYGTNHVEIQPSSGATGNLAGSSQTFTFSNDVDAIGDVYAKLAFTYDKTVGTSTTFADLGGAEHFATRLIKRCEVMVGNSTWQTMENSDIVALNMTTLEPAAYAQLVEMSSKSAASGAADPSGLPTDDASVSMVCYVPLKIFTAGGTARTHLTAGAPHQSFRIKLTFLTPTEAGGDVKNLTCQLFARQHIMTNFERDQIRNNTIVKSLRLTQHAEKTVTGNTASQTLNIELDSFSLLASHLLLSFDATGTAGQSALTNAFVETAELLLNTSSHSGELDGHFMRSFAASDMGLYPNFKYDEDSRSNMGVYVFPLASLAYGADGCPLNRFDTIRLKVKGVFPGCLCSVTCVGTASAVYSKQAASLQYHS